LRTYVKHIDLSSPEDKLEDGVQCFDLQFLSDEEVDWLQDYLCDLDCENRKHLQKELFSEHNRDAVTALILLLCSRNLEVLEIRDGKSPSTWRLASILELAAIKPAEPWHLIFLEPPSYLSSLRWNLLAALSPPLFRHIVSLQSLPHRLFDDAN
jgi:hypothetical protein